MAAGVCRSEVYSGLWACSAWSNSCDCNTYSTLCVAFSLHGTADEALGCAVLRSIACLPSKHLASFQCSAAAAAGYGNQRQQRMVASAKSTGHHNRQLAPLTDRPAVLMCSLVREKPCDGNKGAKGRGGRRVVRRKYPTVVSLAD